MNKIAHKLVVRKRMLLWRIARNGFCYHVAATDTKAAKIPIGRRAQRVWEGME